MGDYELWAIVNIWIQFYWLCHLHIRLKAKGKEGLIRILCTFTHWTLDHVWFIGQNFTHASALEVLLLCLVLRLNVLCHAVMMEIMATFWLCDTCQVPFINYSPQLKFIEHHHISLKPWLFLVPFWICILFPILWLLHWSFAFFLITKVYSKSSGLLVLETLNLALIGLMVGIVKYLAWMDVA